MDDKSYWSSVLRGYDIQEGEDIPGTGCYIPGTTREGYFSEYKQDYTDQVWVSVLVSTISTCIGTDNNKCHGEYRPNRM